MANIESYGYFIPFYRIFINALIYHFKFYNIYEAAEVPWYLH